MKDGGLPDIGQVTTEAVDGLRIRIARGGRPNGSAILFTSPWPESIYAFHRVFPYLVETHRVIAIDLPGYGHLEGRPDVNVASENGSLPSQGYSAAESRARACGES
jgi:pimeloyl-ACP methyl ester carboxylesterase